MPAPPWFDDVDIAILDLDGTVHDDTAFVPVYLALLSEEVGPTAGARIDDEVRRILARRHPVSLGSLYDPGRDEVWAAALRGEGLATTWHGEPLLNPHNPPADALYLGDAWQTVRAVALHHRVDDQALRRAFIRTRQRMNDPAVPLPGAATIDTALAAFAGARHRVLASNTAEALARPLVERLGLSGAFDEIVLDAGKPEGLRALLEGVLARFDVGPERVVCAGDNLRNDIAPARRAGCRTVLVDPFSVCSNGEADVVVRRLVELA
ncbi:MAG: HAD family hydrolase [Egibacteraceae bacterium]